MKSISYILSWVLCIGHVSSICLPKPVVNGDITINDQRYAAEMKACVGLSEPKCTTKKCEWVDYWESGQSWIANEEQSKEYQELLEEEKFSFWEHSGHWRNPLYFPDAKKSKLNPSNKEDWAKMSEEQKAFVLKHDQYPPIAYPSIVLMEKLRKTAQEQREVPDLQELLMNEGFMEISFHNTYSDKKNLEIEETKEVITVYDVDKRSIKNAMETKQLIDKEELLLSMDYNKKQKKLWKISEFQQQIAVERKQIKALESIQSKNQKSETESEEAPNTGSKNPSIINKKSEVETVPQKQGIQRTESLPSKISGTPLNQQSEPVHQKHKIQRSETLPQQNVETVKTVKTVRKRLLANHIGAVPSRRRLIWGRDTRLPVRWGAGAGFLNDHTNPNPYPVDNTMDPFRSVGAIHKWNRGRGRWETHCTAWPLTSRIIVTNGHCIGFYRDVHVNMWGNRKPRYQWQPIRAMRFRPGWTGTASGFDPQEPPRFADFVSWLNNVQTPLGTSHGMQGPARWYVGNGNAPGGKGLPADNNFDGVLAPPPPYGAGLPQLRPIDQGNGRGIGNDRRPVDNCNYGYPGDNAQNCRRFGMRGNRYYLPDDFETVWVAKGWLEPVPMGWTYNGRSISNSDAEIASLRQAKADNTHDFAIIRLRADRAITFARHPYFWLSRVTRTIGQENTAGAQHYTAPVLAATGLGGADAGTFTGLFTAGYPGVWAYNQMTNYFDGSGGGAHGSYVHDREPVRRQWRMHDNLNSGASGSPYIQRDATRRRVFGLHANVFGAGGAMGLEIGQARYNSICAKVNFDSVAIGALLCPVAVAAVGVVGGVMDPFHHAVQLQENIYDGDFGYEYDVDEDVEEEKDDVRNYYNNYYYQYPYHDSNNALVVICLVLIIICVCAAVFAAFGVGCGYFMDDCFSCFKREDKRDKLIV